MARPILLDCDPGHDDALAILLALSRPELDVLAITTVAGNAPLAATTRNTLSVLTLIGRTDVPVAPGADRPMVREASTAASVHGDSGLEGADLPAPAAVARSEGAVECMARSIRQSPQPVTLVATGPLTNVALFLGAHPELASRVAGICFMGGSMGEGNWTASAEFNIWADPEAAARVMRSGCSVTMVGLDVTHQARITRSQTSELDRLGSATGRIFADLLRFFARYHERRYGWDGSPIHDAVAIAALLDAPIVTTTPYRVDVETTSELTRGRTVVDRERLAGRDANAHVATSIDRDAFLELLLAALAEYP